MEVLFQSEEGDHREKGAIDLSIIIVNWNSKTFLLRCLESIAQAQGTFSMETIVVDNGSSDGSVDAVRARILGCHLIENQENLGFAKATNQGIREAQGRYLLLLNPDTVVSQEALERLIAFMDENPEAGVAGVQLLNPDGSKQNSIAAFPSLATELLNKRLLRWFFPKRFPGKERHYSEPIEVDSVIGAAMIVRRRALEDVGDLDEDYFLFLEETDWCYRMKKRGWKVFHVPQAKICHFQGRSVAGEKKRARVEYYRSRYLFFKKNRGPLCCLMLRGGLLVRLVLEVAATGALCLVTFFTRRQWNQRLSLFVYLLAWHLRLCPEGMGLKQSMPPRRGDEGPMASRWTEA